MVSPVSRFALPDYAGWIGMLEVVVWGAVLLALAGKMLSNLRVLFPGLPIPDFATDKRRPEVEAKP